MERKDELEARVREAPLSERLDECRKRIGKMCSEGRPPRMCIPVQWDDDDFYISTTLADAQRALDAARADNRTYINERHENMKTIETLQADHARVVTAATALIRAWANKTPLAWQPDNNRALLDDLVASLPAQPAQGKALIDRMAHINDGCECRICKPAQGGAASKPVTTCNRHSDCDAADEKARAKGALHADHCHDDCCSECFGN